MRNQLTEGDRRFLGFALELAEAQMHSRPDEYEPEDHEALQNLRRLLTAPDPTSHPFVWPATPGPHDHCGTPRPDTPDTEPPAPCVLNPAHRASHSDEYGNRWPHTPTGSVIAHAGS